jgi:PAS domain S-box-containing protein
LDDSAACKKLLEDFADSLPDLIFIFDADGCFELVGGDPGLLLASREELIGRRVDELLPTEIHKNTHKAIKHILAGGETITYEYQLKVPVGLRDFEARFSKMESEAGPRVVCVTRDVSERKKVERRYKLLAENSLDVILLTDEQKRVTYLSPAVRDILGYEPHELIGCSTSEFYAPGEEERVNEITKEVFATKSMKRIPIETRLLHKDGHEVLIELLGSLIYDEQGNFVGSQGSFRDISERKQIEQRYKLLAENAADIIFLTDTQAIITYISPAVRDILGYEPEELVGCSTAETYSSAAEAERVIGIAKENLAARSNKRIPIETTLRHKNGSEVPIEILGSIIFDEQGTFIGSQGVLRDISERRNAELERRKLEEQFQHTQKLESLGVLAGGIAHDFNNLLAGILGNASLALMDMKPENPGTELMHDIKDAALRAAELVRQMLAYSGKGHFVIDRIDLRQVIKEMLPLLKASISKKATLKLEFDEATPFFNADATQLRQILMNLVINASEALGEGSGVISITTGAAECERAYLAGTYLDDDLAEGSYVFIEVSDSGRGMVPEDLKKIFDPFYTTKFAGRGLGLAAVLGIVRGHKGAIDIRSRPGEGTSVKVLIPVEGTEQVPIDTSASEAEPDSEWCGQGPVLLVDDDEIVLKVGKLILERLGCEVTTAGDGCQAIEILEKDPEKFCCIVLDLTMPKMDGEECFRELRKFNASVPVILSSGYDAQELMQRFENRGLAGFLQKPYSAAKMSVCLRQALKATGD